MDFRKFCMKIQQFSIKDESEGDMGDFMHTTLCRAVCFEDTVEGFKCTAPASAPIPCVFENHFKEALIPYPEQSFAAFKNKSNDGSQPEFLVHIYRNDSYYRGLAVAITYKISNKTYILTAENDFSVTLKEGELPCDIPETNHQIIFYQRNFSNGQTRSFHFESSMKQDFYLGFDLNDEEKKLMLKHWPGEELDETIKISLIDNPQNS